jgi:capsular polysaccharide biosynthesis protein
MLIISLLELTDPAFKSERQMARYLEMPVLGTMPDVQRLAEQAQPTER